MWLVGVGGIYGCGCKEVYRFHHTTYPYSSCICSFLKQHPYFLFIFKCFSFFIYMYLRGVCCFLLSLIPNVVAYSSNNFLHDFCQKQNSLRLNGTGLFHEFIEGMISVNKMVKP